MTWEDVGAVTCVPCSLTWLLQPAPGQSQLRSLGERFGRRRIVLDLLGRTDWPMGSGNTCNFVALRAQVLRIRRQFERAGVDGWEEDAA